PRPPPGTPNKARAHVSAPPTPRGEAAADPHRWGAWRALYLRARIRPVPPSCQRTPRRHRGGGARQEGAEELQEASLHAARDLHHLVVPERMLRDARGVIGDAGDAAAG